MLPPRTAAKRNAPPAAHRAIGYALSILLVVSVHLAVAARAAMMFA